MGNQGITVKAKNHYALTNIDTPAYEYTGHMLLYSKLAELTKRPASLVEAIVSGGVGEDPIAKYNFDVQGSTIFSPGTSSAKTISTLNTSNGAWQSDSYYVLPMSLIVRDFTVQLDTAPGAGKKWDFYLAHKEYGTRHNIEISDSNTSGTLTDPYILRKYALFGLVGDPDSSPTNFGLCEYSFNMTNVLEEGYPLFSFHGSELAQTAKQYSTFMGNEYFVGSGSWVTSSDSVKIRASTAGVFSELTAGKRNTMAAGETVTYAIENLTTNQSLSITVTDTPDIQDGAAKGFFGSSGSLTVSKGDELVVSCVKSHTGSLSQVNLAVKFVPTTAGDYTIMAKNLANTSTSAKRYILPRHNGSSSWNSSASARDEKAVRDQTLSDLVIHCPTSPGSGTYNFKIENLTTAQSLSGIITSSNFDNFEVPGTLTINSGDLITVSCEPSSSPDAIQIAWSYKLRDSTAIASQTPETRISYSLMSSAVTDEGAKVSYHVLENRNDYSLVVSVNSNLTPVAKEVSFGNSVALTSNDFGTVYIQDVTIDGLLANTQYYYGIKSNGTIDPTNQGKFKTFPTASTTPASTDTYNILFGSCADITESAANQELASYTQMSSETAEMFIHMGDRGYANIHDHNALGKFIDFYVRYRSNKGSLNLYKNIPSTMALSDHEGPGDPDTLNPDLLGNELIDWTNESNDTRLGFGSIATIMPEVYEGYKKMLPTYPDGQPTGTGFVQGTAHSFIMGQVKVIVLDTQSQRLPSNNPPTALGDGTMSVNAEGGNFLTWNQRQWCKDEMLAAKQSENCKLVIIAWGGGKNFGTDSFFDRYKADSEDLNDYAVTADVPEVIHIYGDYHAAVLDDGQSTTNKFNTGSGHIANFTCAPFFDGIHESVTNFLHRWNGDNLMSGGVDDLNMYAKFIITNDPTSHELGYRVVYRDASDGSIMTDEATSTMNIDVSKSDTTRAIDFDAASSSLANPGINNTLSVQINKSWLGQGEFNLTVSGGTLTKNTDYTITEGDQFTHPNADTKQITITFLTTNTGTITLALANATPADSGSTVGGVQSTHTLTVT